MEANTYQWMIFSPDRLQQWVVRADTQEEFTEAYVFVQELVASALVPQPEAVSSNGDSNNLTEQEPPIPPDQCAIHNKQMKQRQAKNGGTYYDHRWQENDVWHVCNGKTVKQQQPKSTPF